MRHRGVRPLVAAVLAGWLASGCTASGALSEQARAGDAKNYVAGDGSVTQLAAGSRSEPVELTGTTAEGDPVNLADWRGSVVVLNVWYAACAPCRAEAPDLVALANEFSAGPVKFLGINTRDDAAGAMAFQRTHAIPYASVLDAADGSALLALRGQVPPQAVPTTLVLDAEGRVAARVLGRVDGSTLRGLLDDVLAERA